MTEYFLHICETNIESGTLTINGDTSIAATTFVALFSIKPKAAKQLKKFIYNCRKCLPYVKEGISSIMLSRFFLMNTKP